MAFLPVKKLTCGNSSMENINSDTIIIVYSNTDNNEHPRVHQLIKQQRPAILFCCHKIFAHITEEEYVFPLIDCNRNGAIKCFISLT